MMPNMEVEGTTSKALINYIHRVGEYLGLNDYETLFEVGLFKSLSGNAHGYCQGDDELVTVEIARYDAEGRIPLNEIKRSIAHEMLHALQLASGRMVNVGLTMHGKGMQSIKYIVEWEGHEVDMGKVDYENQPWEIDAYGNEMEVYNNCL
tara:strand:+ start:4345 stop:4794 length:450 start_codon:yes stop_codon:yes gene_type:complete